MLLDYNGFHWHDMHAVRFGPIQLHPKPEPIMLLVLPIIPSKNFTHYSYFILMPSPIIPVIFFKFLCQ